MLPRNDNNTRKDQQKINAYRSTVSAVQLNPTPPDRDGITENCSDELALMSLVKLEVADCALLAPMIPCKPAAALAFNMLRTFKALGTVLVEEEAGNKF
jgi:hypothetical protein